MSTIHHLSHFESLEISPCCFISLEILYSESEQTNIFIFEIFAVNLFVWSMKISGISDEERFWVDCGSKYLMCCPPDCGDSHGSSSVGASCRLHEKHSDSGILGNKILDHIIFIIFCFFPRLIVMLVLFENIDNMSWVL